jgi:tetratricopeptide (TPR) repeat protein
MVHTNKYMMYIESLHNRLYLERIYLMRNFIHDIAISLCLLPIFLILNSCGGSKEFDDRFGLAMAGLKGEELLNELYALDQKYQDKLVLKVNIGAMLLAKGDTDKASIYLLKGEEIVDKSNANKLKAELFTHLAELSLHVENYKKGIEYADKSVYFDKSDQMGVVFIKAKCLYYMNEPDKAMATFDDGWTTRKDIMSKDDMSFYMSLLRDKGNYEKALEVAHDYERLFDYEPGIGIIESVFYEKLGKVNESIICAAKDLEYARYSGNIDTKEELTRLHNLEIKANDKSWNPKGLGKETLKGLIYYASDKWEESFAELSKSGMELKGLPFYAFLLKSAILESGKASTRDFSDYRSLEDYFSSFPNYYYHLYRGMSSSVGNPDSNAMRGAMESCILLAPSTVYARQTRIALGEYLGLGHKDGEKLLLAPELDKIYILLLEGRSPRVLDPVFELLALKDNDYTLAAMTMLAKAIDIPGIADFLETKLKTASGRLGEKLGTLLKK